MAKFTSFLFSTFSPRLLYIASYLGLKSLESTNAICIRRGLRWCLNNKSIQKEKNAWIKAMMNSSPALEYQG